MGREHIRMARPYRHYRPPAQRAVWVWQMRCNGWVPGLLTMERKLLEVALVVFCCVFSAPAAACLCNCSIFSTPGKYPITAETKPAGYYSQVFSGLIISTERTREPVV